MFARFILLLMISAWLGWGCTSSRWIIDEEPVPDYTEAQLLQSKQSVIVTGLPNPDRPILTLESRTIESFESPMRLQARRVVQQYRPRYVLLVAGLAATGGLIYLANSESFFDSDLTRSQKNSLYGLSGLVITGTAFNLKPYREPRFTGEQRFLSTVSRITYSDTTSISQNPIDLIIDAWHEEQELISHLQVQLSGSLNLNVISELGLRSYSPENPGLIRMRITSESEVKEITFPLQDVLKRYVRIASRNTPLRSSPIDNTDNIITTVAEASLLPLVETVDGWHRVLLGITNTYVRANEGAVIWRPSISDESSMVVTTTGMSYGSVDVERDLRITTKKNHKAIAILIGNQDYRNPDKRNLHAHRSIRLMRDYLVESLGYDRNRVIMIEDFRTDINTEKLFNINTVTSTIRNLSYTADTDLFVYYTGAGGIVDFRNSRVPGLLPIDGLPGEGIPISVIFSNFSDINVGSLQFFFDTDFRDISSDGIQGGMRVNLLEPSEILLRRNPNSWVLFAADPSQTAGIYVSPDRRIDRIHGIATYYFARAIQDGNTEIDMILRYMNRNMTFSSRRLHNRAQDPLFFGNRTINLLRETTLPQVISD
jgi:hypothetical protein